MASALFRVTICPRRLIRYEAFANRTLSDGHYLSYVITYGHHREDEIRRIKQLSLVVVFATLLMGLGTPAALRVVSRTIEPNIAPDLWALMEASPPGELIPVVVTLHAAGRSTLPVARRQALRNRLVVQQLQTSAEAGQRDILKWLASNRIRPEVREVTSFWIFNGLALKATPRVIKALAARPDVARVTLDRVDLVLVTELTGDYLSPDPAATNVSVIDAPAMWALGYTGEGVVVATVDTGVDDAHPELAERWRGGSNSWFDPYGEHPTNPTDLDGHGTWVTGIMVAGDGSGTSLGVAPDAQWIGVKIFPDRTSPTRSAIHAGFQWLLDPDGDPTTADAPHVVVNAWSFANVACDLEFQPDLIALRAAGILPIFAAGNYGPAESSAVSPANNPAAFAVGATDNEDQIYLYSSRGPSACGEEATIYPEIVAPGVEITTTGRYGSYITESGTSFAAPHVAGALALLLSAYPDLSAEAQAALLLGSVLDLGLPGPDNVFGQGRLDVLAAYDAYEPPPVWNSYLPLMVRRYPYRVYLPLVNKAP